MNYVILFLILVLHPEKRLTVRYGYGELHHHRTRPEHIAMHCDVIAEDLGENPPPGLWPPVQGLVMYPHPPLHCTIFCRIHTVPGAL